MGVIDYPCLTDFLQSSSTWSQVLLVAAKPPNMETQGRRVSYLWRRRLGMGEPKSETEAARPDHEGWTSCENPEV